jgi:MerR family redox-sensitive transcriptional activator SoxR
LQKLNIIRLAQQAGFTLEEIHTLVHEFPEGTPPSARWEVMAQQKLQELAERIRTIETMKGILTQALRCECATLEDCAAEIEQAGIGVV